MSISEDDSYDLTPHSDEYEAPPQLKDYLCDDLGVVIYDPEDPLQWVAVDRDTVLDVEGEWS